MKLRIAHLAIALGMAGAVSVGCSSDDDSATPPKGGAAGTAGKAGSGGNGGDAGSTAGGGAAGEGAGAAGVEEQGGTAGAAGDTAGGGPGGEGGGAGEAPIYTQAQIERGKVIVRSEALCGGCHTPSGGPELGGNPAFRQGALPAPNLTNDATGIGEWTDQQVINAIKNGVDDEGRHLDPVMPYYLFHNMSDADALSVVAFLRSVPPVSAAVGENNPDATPISPLSPSSLPDTSLPTTSPDYADAVKGKYLVSGVAQCVRCHSPSASGLPAPDYFSGVAPTSATAIFAPNITPDDPTGLATWTAADVVKALKEGINKAGRTLCGSMPSAAKGYGGMPDADAHAIGVYLTTIPAISKPTTDPDLQPACPATP